MTPDPLLTPKEAEPCLDVSQLGLEFLNGRLTITIEQTASVLGIGRSTAYEAARRGEIPVLRIGRRVIVPVPALRSLLGLNVAPEEHTLGDVGN